MKMENPRMNLVLKLFRLQNWIRLRPPAPAIYFSFEQRHVFFVVPKTKTEQVCFSSFKNCTNVWEEQTVKSCDDRSWNRSKCGPKFTWKWLWINCLYVCKSFRVVSSVVAKRNTKNGEEDHESGWYLNYSSTTNARYSQQTGILPTKDHQETVSTSDKDCCFRIRKTFSAFVL